MKALDVNENTTKEGHDLSTVESQANGQLFEDVFSNENGEVKFRGVSWQAAAVLVAKFQIGLGALSLPRTFHVLGFFPGILCFLVLAMISTIAGYLCGNARQYYPHMHSIADASELLFGKGAREVVGFIYYLYLAMTAGAGALVNPIFTNVVPGFMLLFYVARKPVKVTDTAAMLRREQSAAPQEQHWLVEAMATCKKGELKDAAMVAVGAFMILSGAFIIVGGTYSTIHGIKKSYDDGLIGGVFSCGDNSI
ncbi:N amino acid transport system protein [Colletotrichum siamense]|uniref:N amino acid transport system protein n=1 Tax=Colletotrichum siamense TaxID=690259 RepID=A0A9P5BPF2_COLSI|nr:N amino acid transport system protein [Colletotrichum siamense]KAF4845081.1 N amino acid transport system protein [Colletotrichum siamense]